MSLQAEVGQLLVVGVDAGAPAADSAGLRTENIGGVILTGHSNLSTSDLREQVGDLDRALAVGPLSIMPLVAVDQEGGDVQNLVGPGFSRIPSALDQGMEAPTQLRSSAHQWALQLAAAGVDLDLAPVADIVPPGNPDANPPIGAYDREYGHTSPSVVRAVRAVVQGFSGTGSGMTVKHFPGLGTVAANTDVSADVHDDTISGTAEQLAPFSAGIAAGAAAVMVSSAIYDLIDPRREAVFSSPIITGLLRGRLGWNGVVISDDLGRARAVSSYPAGDRAVMFVQAGGDLVLTVDPATVPAMTAALLGRARTDESFRHLIDRAVERVLRLKVALGLVRRS